MVQEKQLLTLVSERFKSESHNVQTLKSYFQTTLKRIGLYHRLKASLVYDLYWKVVDRSVTDGASRELDFYRALLYGFRPGDLIFDVGANHGTKTGIFLKLGARVIAIEPDEVNQGILEKTFLKYRLRPKPVIIVGNAVSDTMATASMWVDEPGAAKNTLSHKWVDALRKDEGRFGHVLQFGEQKQIETTTLEQLTVVHGSPFFIKIDVEGFELNVLKGMQRPVPYLSFEVNLPEFRPEGLQCVELLGRLADNGKFNYASNCCQGLALERWLDFREFPQALNQCTEPSIEVFWKTLADR